MMFFNNQRSEPLTPVDHAWLRMEDPTNLMMVTGLLVFDGPLDFARLRAALEHRLLRFDRFRQRVVANGDSARWETDPHFDLRAHLHRIALPAPHDQHALQELVGDLMSTPLDWSKSPWQFHLIEGYNGGCALLSRLHHCIADGIALVHVLLALTERAPDAPWPSAQEAEDRARGDRGAGMAAEHAATGRLTAPLERARAADLAKRSIAGATALSRLVLMSPDPRTALKGPLGVAKRAAWSRPVPLEQIKVIGRATGATVNDIVLAAVTGALRRYLQSRGELVDGRDIRAAVPVNLRAPNEPPSLGNHFGLVFLALPIGADDPLDRLLDLKERMAALKDSSEALVTYGLINAFGVLPAQLEELGLLLFGSKATAVITNVAGPPEMLYLAGAPLKEIMFWVPQSGRLGLGISVLSYAGQARLGLATDAGLVPDPEQIIASFHDEFELLLQQALQA